LYILTGKNPTLSYNGFISNIINRVNQYRLGTASKYTKKYNIHEVVYFQETGPRTKAYARENKSKRDHERIKLISWREEIPMGMILPPQFSRN
jgi:putative endonuclease